MTEIHRLLLYHNALLVFGFLVLHETHEVGGGGTDGFLLVFPELSCEVLPFEQILMPLEILWVNITCTPIRKLHFSSHSSKHFLGLLHKFLHLLLILQLDELFSRADFFSS